jgi:hypothetical protein
VHQTGGRLAALGLTNEFGYDDVVNNNRADAIGEVAGSVRLHKDSARSLSDGSGLAKQMPPYVGTVTGARTTPVGSFGQLDSLTVI